MANNAWKIEVGLNNVPAYQVSGRPYASGGINATTPTYVTFPYVTRWVYVINHGAVACKVGFSEAVRLTLTLLPALLLFPKSALLALSVLVSQVLLE